MPILGAVLTNYDYAPYSIRYGRPGEAEQRAIFTSAEITRQLDEESPKFDDATYQGITTKLDRFVAGRRVSVSTPSSAKKNGDLKGLNGYGDVLFEFRFFEVAPQQRMLGVFPEKDIFVALGIFERGKLDYRWPEICTRMLKKIDVMGNNKPPLLTHSNLSKVLSNWSDPK